MPSVIIGTSGVVLFDKISFPVQFEAGGKISIDILKAKLESLFTESPDPPLSNV